ncbi:MAG: SDR family NAD(P)-dependent oxidoreductase [Candidatus Woesearchaeota archaeon]
MFNLKNKVAVITGAAGGLGESMAIALSNQGAQIAILDFKDGTKVCKKLKTKSKYYKIDTSNEENMIEVSKQVFKDFKKVDILINNAGIYFPTPINTTKLQDWNKIININLTGYFLIAKHFANKMTKGGKIINISSVAGHHASASSSAYNATKGAVIQLTKTMALEYAGKLNVNAICPGLFVTSMTKNMINAMKSTIQNSIPLKRAGKAEELGGLAVYLSSDESSYMTGSIITIDGGWTCHL